MAFLPLVIVQLFLISYITTTIANVHPPARAPAPHHHEHHLEPHHVAHSPAMSPGYKHPHMHSPVMSLGYKHHHEEHHHEPHHIAHSPAMSPGYKHHHEHHHEEHHVTHSPAMSPGYKHHHKEHHHEHHVAHSPTMSPGYKHHHMHSPAMSPGHKHPHMHSPAMSPGYDHPHKPANAPAYHRKKMLAVQGYVFCKTCKSAVNDTLKGATPLEGAVLKLKCNTKNGMTETTTTHHNGFFWISAKNQTAAAFSKCKVFLVSSPSKNCTVATNLHGGVSGATMMPETKGPDHRMPFEQFHVGPFAFAPVKKNCHY